MYVKLYSSIVTSSIWSEDSDTCKVWITLLALADRSGFVFGSSSGLARIAAVEAPTVRTVLEKFMAPDPESSDLVRNPEGEGRRLKEIEGGWQILNYEHYRDMRDADTRRVQTRDAVRKHRKLLKASVSPSESESYSESDAKPLREKARFAPPTTEEVQRYISEKGYTFDAEAFVAYYEARGWKLANGKMASWKAACVTWQKREKPANASAAPSPAAIIYFNRLHQGLNAKDYLDAYRAKFGCDPEGI
jgi:hypothetical protein